MEKYLFIFLLLLLAPSYYAGRYYFRKLRRRKLAAQPFPHKWRIYLQQNIPLYSRLPDEIKEQLHEDVKIFIEEKQFEGCGGLELTDEMRVTIAGHACVLLLNRRTDVYPRLHTVLVYPGEYEARKATLFEFEDEETHDVNLGESWAEGYVVLAWDHVKKGARDMRRRHNVALHEFAHQLDQEDGDADGAPILEHSSSYSAWARVLGSEYEKLRRDVTQGYRTDIDEYGAEDPAEFFSVVTEAFFEKPVEMKEKHPELYEELRNYYQLDPAGWQGDSVHLSVNRIEHDRSM